MTEDELRETVRKVGFIKMGIANPADLETTRHPQPLLEVYPWAKSVLILVYPSPDRCLDYDIGFDFPIGQNKQFNKWIYNIIYQRAAVVADALKEAGYRAIYGSFILGMLKAAVLAGLGSLGDNHLLLTKELGPRVRLISVVTDLPLEPSPSRKEDLCLPGCTLCQRRCPAGALRDGEYDPEACRIYFRGVQVSDLVWATCVECMHSCPVGIRKIAFYDRINRHLGTRDSVTSPQSGTRMAQANLRSNSQDVPSGKAMSDDSPASRLDRKERGDDY